MSSRAKGVARFAAGVALVLTLGCAGFERGAPSPAQTDDDAPTDGDGGGDSGGGGVSFATDVFPALQRDCGRCHNGQGSGSFAFQNDAEGAYEAALGFVDEGDPGASPIVGNASGRGHGGGAVWPQGSVELQTLVTWIAGGAQP